MYTSLHDPAEAVKQGYNDKLGVGVWGKAGKTKVNYSATLVSLLSSTDEER